MSRKNRKQEQVVTELPELVPSTTEAATEAATVQPTTTEPTLYSVVAPKRPLTGKKFGVSGNEYTHSKLAEAAAQNGGTLTADQARQVCVDAAHKGFYTYAINRLHILVPVNTANVEQQVKSEMVEA